MTKSPNDTFLRTYPPSLCNACLYWRSTTYSTCTSVSMLAKCFKYKVITTQCHGDKRRKMCVTARIQVWDVMPWCWVSDSQRSEESWRLHINGQAVPEVFSGCLAAENEWANILKNIGNNPPNDTASHPTIFELLITLLQELHFLSIWRHSFRFWNPT